MQIVVVKKDADTCHILKHYIFERRVSCRKVRSMVHGKAMVFEVKAARNLVGAMQVIYRNMCFWMASYYNMQPKAKSRNAKKEKEPVEPSELQEGFDFIGEEGPRCSIDARQLEWAEMEIRRQGSPLFGWSSGLVKECRRGHSSAHVSATPVTNFYLALHDVAAWFLDDVLVPILPGNARWVLWCRH